MVQQHDLMYIHIGLMLLQLYRESTSKSLLGFLILTSLYIHNTFTFIIIYDTFTKLHDTSKVTYETLYLVNAADVVDPL